MIGALAGHGAIGLRAGGLAGLGIGVGAAIIALLALVLQSQNTGLRDTIVTGPLSSRWAAAGMIAAAGALLLGSRAPLAPTYLTHFDSVNFALALEDFNLQQHRPQPPGYPLFVLLSRLLNLTTGSPERTFQAVGILASLAAVALVWRLGRNVFGVRAAYWAAWLCFVSPPFWITGIANQVRLFLAVGSAAVMLAVWRSLQEDRPRYFYAAGAILGLASGFRPDLLAFAGPLVLYAGWRRRRSLRQWTVAGALTAAAVGLWLAPAALAGASGLYGYAELIGLYAKQQFVSTTALFGGDGTLAARTMQLTVTWYGLPVLTWLWLAPFAAGAAHKLRGTWGFLAVAVLPGFLFHAFIHIGEPGHMLIATPALCVIGGAVLASARWMAAGAAVALNVLLFFTPPESIPWARSLGYPALKEIDSIYRETIPAIEELRQNGRVVLVEYDHTLTWRHLFYYFRGEPLVVLLEDPRSVPRQESAWVFLPGTGREMQVYSAEVKLPPARRIAWLVSTGRGMHRLLQQTVDLKRIGALAYSDVEPGMHLRFGGYEFTVAEPNPGRRTP